MPGSFFLLIACVLEEGILSTQQAAESCRWVESALARGEQVTLESFWESKGWLSEEQGKRLSQKMRSETGAGEVEDLPVILGELAQEPLNAEPEEQGDGSLELMQEEFSVEVVDERTSPFGGILGDVEALADVGALGDTASQIWPDSDRSGQTREEGLSQTYVNLPVVSEAMIEELTTTGEVDVSAWKGGIGSLVEPARRYEIIGELGQGGLGLVFEVFDHNLGRKVACKMLRKREETLVRDIAWFVEEASLTSKLAHPNIMTIHDLGFFSKEQPFYTMPLIRSRDLDEELEDRSMTLFQYVKVLQQLCMGLAYAHSRGVVHRDVKPANILLGKYGEVFLIDWGIARSYDPENMANNYVKEKVRGTLNYMPPEQIRDKLVAPSVDQYAVGVILYRILTGVLPFPGKDFKRLRHEICNREVVPPRSCAPQMPIPEELEWICMKMLQKEAAERFRSCREVHDALEKFLEGSEQIERRRQMAKQRVSEGHRLGEAYHQMRSRTTALKKEWRDAKEKIKPWESLDKKREIWAKEEEFQATLQRTYKLFSMAVQKFEQALEHERQDPQAREGLAHLYWSRFQEAEAQGDEQWKSFYLDLVRVYDDGTFTRKLQGDCALSLRTTPVSARVSLFRYEEQGYQLEAHRLLHELATPLEVPLPTGSYLCVLSAEGYGEVRYPFELRYGQRHEAELRMWPESTVDERYIYVPASQFGFGGDEAAPMGLPRETVFVDDFFISRYPVTFGEYLQYLNALHLEDPAAAEERLPRVDGQETYVYLDDRGLYVPNRAALLHGPIGERYPKGERFAWELPVLGVTWFEALLYCRWRSDKEGRRITLPSEQQWEKAASGADLRLFPWGNRFDATFCKMARSRPPSELQPEPVGVFIYDKSPYGMRDVVGTIGEWTLSMEPEEADEVLEEGDFLVVQRGGGWLASNEDSMRIRARAPKIGSRSYNCGFRVAILPDKPA